MANLYVVCLFQGGAVRQGSVRQFDFHGGHHPFNPSDEMFHKVGEAFSSSP
jgi:hypothetical protein